MNSYVCVCLLVSEKGMEVDDEVVLILGEVASLDVGPQVVGPPQAAALAAAVEPRQFWQSSPASVPMPSDVLHQLLVLLRRPRPLLHLA